jgi:DNA-directed RNA polymerase subunit M/transcription elongation factor TFIIS
MGIQMNTVKIKRRADTFIIHEMCHTCQNTLIPKHLIHEGVTMRAVGMLLECSICGGTKQIEGTEYPMIVHEQASHD